VNKVAPTMKEEVEGGIGRRKKIKI